MKHSVKILAGAVIGMAAFAGCSTFRPLQGNNTAVTANAQVLGRVTVERSVKTSGYTVLLKEALKQYPGADDIVNIIVDERRVGKNVNYIMSAVVVKYSR